MTLQYQYDSTIDFKGPDKKTKFMISIHSGIMLLCAGIYFAKYMFKSQETFDFVIFLICLISAIISLVYILNDYKPIAPKGKSNYLKIEDQKIVYKAYRNKLTEIVIQNVQYIRFEEQDVRFVFQNGNEEYLPLSFIQNQEKRKELELLLKKMFKH